MRRTKAKFWVALGMFFLASNSAFANNEDKQTERIEDPTKANIGVVGDSSTATTDRNTKPSITREINCGTIYLRSYDPAFKDATYTVFAPTDKEKKKQIGKLEIVDGKATLTALTKVTLAEAEKEWGLARKFQLPHATPTCPDAIDHSRYIFDYAAYSSRFGPKKFEVIVKMDGDLISNYAVNGPGIKSLEYKEASAL